LSNGLEGQSRSLFGFKDLLSGFFSFHRQPSFLQIEHYAYAWGVIYRRPL
jgi:hypothetical protein